MTTLRDRLEDLASDAPAPPPAYAGELWTRGKRRQRRRVAGAVVAAAAVAAVAVGVPMQLGPRSAEPSPVTTLPSEDLHLPDRVLPPAGWSAGTADAGEIGPLAAIGDAQRLEVDGLLGEQQHHAIFGVSAVDGTSRFLDLGLDDGEPVPWLGPYVALSPDGRKVAFVREEYVPDGLDGQETVAVGWGVYDTVTGELTELSDPAVPRLAGHDTSDLAFTGDSRHLMTAYSFDGTWQNHAFVLWDVETGERTVVEPPGHRWLPSSGPAPRGVLWAREHQVHAFDPATGERSSFRLPHAVVMPSVGPDESAFAYIGGDWQRGTGEEDGGIHGPWRLYAGPDRQHLEQLPLPFEPGLVVGWRDERRVVVSDHHDRYAVVDVHTGDTEVVRIQGTGGSSSQLAADMWANQLVPGVEPPDAADPRTRWWAAGGVVVALAVLGGLVLRRRRVRR